MISTIYHFIFTDRNGDVKDIAWKIVMIDPDDEKDLAEKLTSFVGRTSCAKKYNYLGLTL